MFTYLASVKNTVVPLFRRYHILKESEKLSFGMI